MMVKFSANGAEMAIAERCHEEYGASVHRMFALAREWSVSIAQLETLYAFRDRSRGISIVGLVGLMRRLSCDAWAVVDLIEEAVSYYDGDYRETIRHVDEIVDAYRCAVPADVITALEVMHTEYDPDEDEWVFA
jgi:hypothetical protein